MASRKKNMIKNWRDYWAAVPFAATHQKPVPWQLTTSTYRNSEIFPLRRKENISVALSVFSVIGLCFLAVLLWRKRGNWLNT
jgi:hypothetical protein